MGIYMSTYVNNTYTPKFRPLKTLDNVSTSLFRIYIFSRTISLRINVCQQRIYPEISMFKNNCQRIYVTFSYIYIYIHILSVNISMYVYDEHTPKFRCFKTRVNVSTSYFCIYIFSRTIGLRIYVCQQRIYPEI